AGDGVRRPREHLREASGEGAGLAGGDGALPVPQDEGALVVVQDGDAPQREVGAGGDGLEDADEAAHQAPRVVLGEQVGAVVDAQGQAAAGHGGEGQRVVGGVVAVHVVEGEAAEVGAGGVRVERVV